MGFQNCFGWLTLLVLGQAIVWSLAAWPLSRMLALVVTLCLYLSGACATWVFKSPLVLPPLFFLALPLAWAGLQAMRHGQWQGLAWQRFFAGWLAWVEWRVPERFRSPAQAQAWFEWRRWGFGVCVSTLLLALVPVGISLLCVAWGCSPLSVAAMDGFTLYLIYMPPFIFFTLGIVLTYPFSQGLKDQSFVLVRPVSSGALIMSLLKTIGIATLVTWAGVWLALSALPRLGDFHAVVLAASPVRGFKALVLGLMFLTWRLGVINLGLGFLGNRFINLLPGLLPAALCLGGAIWLNVSDSRGASGAWLLNHGSSIATGLLIVKFLLATAAFRRCLQDRLLDRAEVVRYLGVWALLVTGLLGIVLILSLLAPPMKEFVLRACLAVVLLVPLARIGFAPLALARSRHAR